MKWVVTITYALGLCALLTVLSSWALTHLPVLVAVFFTLFSLYAYAFLMNRRLQRAHPTEPSDRQRLDRLVSGARFRGAQGAYPRVTTPARRAHRDLPGPAGGSAAAAPQVAAPPPPSQSPAPFERIIAAAPGPAVGANPTYKITLLQPTQEAQQHIFWVNEAQMPECLRLLQKHYLSSPARPRVAIEPAFDLRIANFRERQARLPGWQERIYTLPHGLRPQFNGLLT